MSMQLLPHQEMENNEDYQRWQFETARAEWEAEESQQHPCLHPALRLFSHLAHHGYKRRLVRLASCRVCGFVVAGEIE